jgi:hypothetical protein
MIDEIFAGPKSCGAAKPATQRLDPLDESAI